MKCIILAAGYATRLYPLTENFPKPLLKVGGKCILDWLIDDLNQGNKIDEYVVVSNHKYAVHFEKWAKERTEKIVVIDDKTTSNETRLGAVRDIELAVNSTDIKEDTLIMAGDNVLDFSLNGFVDYFLNKKNSCIMRYEEPDYNKLKKCGVIEVDETDRVISMEEKPENPKSSWICPPFYCLTYDALKMIGEAINQGCGTDAPGSFIGWLVNNKKVYSMKMNGSRYDVGNLESYNKISSEYKGITK